MDEFDVDISATLEYYEALICHTILWCSLYTDLVHNAGINVKNRN